LFLAGLFATIGFAPVAALLTFFFVADPLLGWTFAGPAGLAGIIGGWLRLWLPGARFQSSPTLTLTTIILLGFGILGACIGFFVSARGEASYIVFFTPPCVAVGVFLLGATVGEGKRAP
jgi:hypothetical protein